MSLKAFHIVFIVASILLSFGVGVWGLVEYYGRHSGNNFDLVLGFGSLLGGVALICYGVSVLKKLRHISYL